MKNVIVIALALAFFAVSGFAEAKPSVEEELPITLGIIVQMPDGSIQLIQLPQEPVVQEEIGIDVNFELQSIIFIPQVYFWQSGWFYYYGLVWFGWRGPNGYDWVMTIDQTGHWHCWFWNSSFWSYGGIL